MEQFLSVKFEIISILILIKLQGNIGFTGNDPEEDYQSFDKNASRLDQLLREPTEQERAGASFNFMYSDFYQKPVINGVGGNLNRGSVISEARSGVKDVLVRRAIEVEKDPKVRELFERARLKRGRGSPFFYPDYQVYDFSKLIGAEQAGTSFRYRRENCIRANDWFCLARIF